MNELYNYVKERLGEKPTIQKIIVIAPQIIKSLQEIGANQYMSGQEKKLLLFETLSKVINEIDMDPNEKKNIEEFIDNELPFIVDSIVFAYKSEIFKQIKNKARKCIGRCCK